ncbi:MAG TPA: efflux RND transporter periplasmic adaptor subunit [bacterium]|nr:efflux RND transporter periplasmic adaptor subunit [bacterium]
MKTKILIGIIGIGIGMVLMRWLSPSSEAQTSAHQIAYYRSPMNPLETSTTPKKDAMGMDYVPIYADESLGSGSEKKIKYYHDPMHPWFTSDKPGKAPDCGMDLTPVYEGDEGAGQGIKINPVTIQNIGVKTEIISRRKLMKSIRAVGKIDYNETKVYSISSKVMGWIETLHVNYTGQAVRRGEPLYEIYSPDFVNAQQEYLQAFIYDKQTQQMADMNEFGKTSSKLLQSAKQKLLFWDIPESDIKSLEERGTVRRNMTVYSQVDGIVMEKMISKGQNIMAGMELYKIVDLSTVWIQAEIYQSDLAWVHLGQLAEIELSYLPGKTFTGTVSYLSPVANLETKTIRVRIETANTAGMDLKPEMFATISIQSSDLPESVVIPQNAVIRSGERNIAIVAQEGGYFDPREVTLGFEADGFIQIKTGIHEGERLVVSSQFLIDSESNLKAAVNAMMQNSMKTTTIEKEHTSDAEHKVKTGSIYTCPMHPEVTSDKPGDCPKCGMHLELKK